MILIKMFSQTKLEWQEAMNLNVGDLFSYKIIKMVMITL